MSYSIKVLIYQTNPGSGKYFGIVEKATKQSANPDGAWDEVSGCHVLKMSKSGHSGSLRFLSDAGGSFVVTLGVHNNKRWGDIVTDLQADQTARVINAEYYSKEHPLRVAQRERQLSEYQVADLQGVKYSLEYTVAEGNDLTVRIVIA